MRTPLIVALAASLVGCSREPTRQATAESCTDTRELTCSNRTAPGEPIRLASFKADPPAEAAKLAVATKTEKPPLHRVRKKAQAAGGKRVIAAKAKSPATRVPPPALARQPEPKGGTTTAAGSVTTGVAAASVATGVTVTDSRSLVDPAANSNGRAIQEQVAAATAVAERMTVATATAARDGAQPIAGALPNDTEPLIAVVMVRPEIRSAFALSAQDVAIDDRYSVPSADIRIAIVAAGGPVVELSAGKSAAIDRLVNGEVSAAVVALVSPDAAEAFPEITGFRIFRIPLSPSYLTPRPGSETGRKVPKRSH